MCRQYQLISTCDHDRTWEISCTKAQERGWGCISNAVHKVKQQNAIICSECFLAEGESSQHNTQTVPQTMEPSVRLEMVKIFNRIESIRNIILGRPDPEAPPFQQIRRISHSDREYLESVVPNMVAFLRAGHPDVPKRIASPRIVRLIIRLLEYNIIVDAHEDFLAEPSKEKPPRFFTPIGLDKLGDNVRCPVCLETFNDERELPICFPCDTRHIVCSGCGPYVLKSAGATCPMCRAAFNESQYDFEGVLEAGLLRTWTREFVVSPWWREIIDDDTRGHTDTDEDSGEEEASVSDSDWSDQSDDEHSDDEHSDDEQSDDE